MPQLYTILLSDGHKQIKETAEIDVIIQRFLIPGYGIENLLCDPEFNYIYLEFGLHTISIEKNNGN
jgi:hypothetical protein